MSEPYITKRADAGTRIRPAADSPRGTYTGRVLENRALCTDHYRLTLAVPGFPASVPGQFVQLNCRDHGNEVPPDAPRAFDWPPEPGRRTLPADPDFAAPLAYLRRPFSIADQRTRPDGTAELDIIHRVVGRGTSVLAKLRPGGGVSLLGPLGVGFPVPADLQCACLVGGGVGIPPMLYLAKALAGKNCRRVAFLGAQRRDLLPVTLAGPDPSPSGEPLMDVVELSAYGCPAAVTTDDGSAGLKGFVTQALRQFLAAREKCGTIVYCCGPTPMMKATGRVAAEFGIPCFASLEQPMACGMGTCQSCIIRYRPHTAPPETDWKYKLTCTDGPVFDTRDILW
jgi:dihydroorotate dehydrogenase electron transfer subunit